jgi:hypothetical protein
MVYIRDYKIPTTIMSDKKTSNERTNKNIYIYIYIFIHGYPKERQTNIYIYIYIHGYPKEQHDTYKFENGTET